jgi:hypothetical protein
MAFSFAEPQFAVKASVAVVRFLNDVTGIAYLLCAFGAYIEMLTRL